MVSLAVHRLETEVAALRDRVTALEQLLRERPQATEVPHGAASPTQKKDR